MKRSLSLASTSKESPRRAANRSPVRKRDSSSEDTSSGNTNYYSAEAHLTQELAEIFDSPFGGDRSSSSSEVAWVWKESPTTQRVRSEMLAKMKRPPKKEESDDKIKIPTAKLNGLARFELELEKLEQETTKKVQDMKKEPSTKSFSFGESDAEETGPQDELNSSWRKCKSNTEIETSLKLSPSDLFFDDDDEVPLVLETPVPSTSKEKSPIVAVPVPQKPTTTPFQFQSKAQPRPTVQASAAPRPIFNPQPLQAKTTPLPLVSKPEPKLIQAKVSPVVPPISKFQPRQVPLIQTKVSPAPPLNANIQPKPAPVHSKAPNANVEHKIQTVRNPTPARISIPVQSTPVPVIEDGLFDSDDSFDAELSSLPIVVNTEPAKESPKRTFQRHQTMPSNDKEPPEKKRLMKNVSMPVVQGATASQQKMCSAREIEEKRQKALATLRAKQALRHRN